MEIRQIVWFVGVLYFVNVPHFCSGHDQGSLRATASEEETTEFILYSEENIDKNYTEPENLHLRDQLARSNEPSISTEELNVFDPDLTDSKNENSKTDDIDGESQNSDHDIHNKILVKGSPKISSGSPQKVKSKTNQKGETKQAAKQISPELETHNAKELSKPPVTKLETSQKSENNNFQENKGKSHTLSDGAKTSSEGRANSAATSKNENDVHSNKHTVLSKAQLNEILKKYKIQGNITTKTNTNPEVQHPDAPKKNAVTNKTIVHENFPMKFKVDPKKVKNEQLAKDQTLKLNQSESHENSGSASEEISVTDDAKSVTMQSKGDSKKAKNEQLEKDKTLKLNEKDSSENSESASEEVSVTDDHEKFPMKLKVDPEKTKNEHLAKDQTLKFNQKDSDENSESAFEKVSVTDAHKKIPMQLKVDPKKAKNEQLAKHKTLILNQKDSNENYKSASEDISVTDAHKKIPMQLKVDPKKAKNEDLAKNQDLKLNHNDSNENSESASVEISVTESEHLTTYSPQGKSVQHKDNVPSNEMKNSNPKSNSNHEKDKAKNRNKHQKVNPETHKGNALAGQGRMHKEHKYNNENHKQPTSEFKVVVNETVKTNDTEKIDSQEQTQKMRENEPPKPQRKPESVKVKIQEKAAIPKPKKSEKHNENASPKMSKQKAKMSHLERENTGDSKNPIFVNISKTEVTNGYENIVTKIANITDFNEDNIEPKIQISSTKLKQAVSSSTARENYSTSLVAVTFALILSTFLLTVVGVYYRKLNFGRRRWYIGHSLMENDDEVPLFNRDTYQEYHDQIDGYESWKMFA